MADAGMIALIDQAREFFSALDSAPAAGAPLVRYPVELMITTPQERLAVQFRDGRPGAVSEATADAAIGYWTLELRGGDWRDWHADTSEPTPAIAPAPSSTATRWIAEVRCTAPRKLPCW